MNKTRSSGELSSEESIDWADKFYSEFVEIIDPESDHAHPSLVSPNPYPIKQFLATEINRAKEEGRREVIAAIERHAKEVGWDDRALQNVISVINKEK